MKINTLYQIKNLYRHQADIDAEAMLSRPLAYPDSFTLADRTAERMNRARKGLAHVMCELLPHADSIDADQKASIHCWLDAVLMIVDATRIDAEVTA